MVSIKRVVGVNRYCLTYRNTVRVCISVSVDTLRTGGKPHPTLNTHLNFHVSVAASQWSAGTLSQFVLSQMGGGVIQRSHFSSFDRSHAHAAPSASMVPFPFLCRSSIHPMFSSVICCVLARMYLRGEDEKTIPILLKVRCAMYGILLTRARNKGGLYLFGSRTQHTALR